MQTYFKQTKTFRGSMQDNCVILGLGMTENEKTKDDTAASEM